MKIPQERREKGEENGCKTKENGRETRENEWREGGKAEKGKEKRSEENSTTAERYRTFEGSSERGDPDGGNGRETTAIGAGTSEIEEDEDERAKTSGENLRTLRKAHSDGGA